MEHINTQELIDRTVKWFSDRKITQNSSALVQFAKLTSEFGELNNNIANHKSVKDDIGDCLVVCIGICTIVGISTDKLFNKEAIAIKQPAILSTGSALGKLADSVLKSNVADMELYLVKFVASLDSICFARHLELNECLYTAYQDIKDRKGITLPSGVFVKESDENYERLVKESN